MLAAQFELLNNQLFTSEDGVSYNILRLVKWAEQNCYVQYVPVSRLIHEFESGGQRSDEEDGSQEFVERALATEDFPLVIQQTREGKMWVMDGRHRLWKHIFLDGRDHVQAYVIPVEDLPSEAVDEEGVVWVI